MAILIGFDMLHYALNLTDVPAVGATPGTVTYGAPKRILGAVSANVNPNSSDGTFFGDDGPMETASALGQIDLELSAADIPFEDQVVMLGHSIDAKGVLVRKSTDTPPWLAVGGRSLKSNGKYRYFWLLKGKMSVPEKAHQTKTDSIEYQAANIKGAFVKRDSDSSWIIEIDEDSAGVDAATIAGWFTNVPVIVPVVTP